VGFLHPVGGKQSYIRQYSTRTRVAKLRARLESEREERVRAAIVAQLRAFERPPRGSFD